MRGGVRDRRDYRRIGVAEDERPPGEDVVDVLVAIEIEQARARPALDEERVAADGAESPDRTVHPTGNDPLRGGERLSRAGDGQARGGGHPVRSPGPTGASS